MKNTLVTLCMALFLVACGGGKKGVTTPVEGEEPVVGPPDAKWDDMTHQEKLLYMKRVVLPKMGPIFAAYDGKKFAQVNCVTCHGEGATSGTFKMPNPQIFKLPATEEGFKEIAAKEPQWVQFMATQVKPEMAKLIGEPEFDPAHPEAGGFGCFECHTKAEP